MQQYFDVHNTLGRRLRFKDIRIEAENDEETENSVFICDDILTTKIREYRVRKYGDPECVY
jgi:hypothetical protein